VPLTATVPYQITRIATVMTSQPGEPFEALGVLNPASGRDPDGRLHLLPRLVAAGNVSRVGLARVVLRDGVPVGVERRGIVLSPDEDWERGAGHGGVEDPRTTWMPDLGLHLMTYAAFGPLGPRPALAISPDLTRWRRLGPVQFAWQPDLGVDLGLFPNKDAVFFPAPVPDRAGRPCYAMLHRPMWDLSWVHPGEGVHLPLGLTDERLGIWISYVPVEDVRRDVRALARLDQHRLVALPAHPFEATKIGAGPPPVRVEEGWLLLHHGVRGAVPPGFDEPPQAAVYSAGAMLLDPDDPAHVLARTSMPLLEPQTRDEQHGIAPNVVFPTAIEEIDGVRHVFYGMADHAIGVARLEHE